MSEASPESPDAPSAPTGDPEPKTAEEAKSPAEAGSSGEAENPAAAPSAAGKSDADAPKADEKPDEKKDAPDSKFTGTPAADKPKKKKKSRLRRAGCFVVLAMPVLAIALWIAIHTINGFGPWLANLGRSILGDEAIAKLEDWAYGVQDSVNLATRGDEKPKAAWDITPRQEITKDPDVIAKFKYPDFEPKDVGPMLQSFSAPGDGVWVAVPDPRNPDEPAPMFKTLVHPDPKRGWTQVAVVAMDLRQIDLHIVAGTIEPITTLADAKAKKRAGVIAQEDLGSVMAAFNGGFMATHGHHGMKSDGVTWIEPHDKGCTIAQTPLGIIIRSWEEISSGEAEMAWFRQTPMCLEEQGKLHPGLTLEDNTYWGATLDKETIIRRSGMGISEDGKTLFIAIGEATSAVAIAKALQFVGSYNVAQLDVNFTYPKFVFVLPHPGGPNDLELKPLVDTFKYSNDDYIKRPHPRDFFYVTRQAAKKAEPKKEEPKPNP